MGVRIYVGRLPADATKTDLQDRFQRILPKNVKMIEVELMSNSNASDFAYLELQSIHDNPEDEELAVQAVVQAYHNTKWKGKRLRVESAHPDYLQRLKEEWEATEESKKQIQETRLNCIQPVPTNTNLTLKASKRYKGYKLTFDEDGNAVQEQEPLSLVNDNTPACNEAESIKQHSNQEDDDMLSSESSDEEEIECAKAPSPKKRPLDDLSSESSDDEMPKQVLSPPKKKQVVADLSSESSEEEDANEEESDASDEDGALSSVSHTATVASTLSANSDSTSSSSEEEDDPVTTVNPSPVKIVLKTDEERRAEANERRLAALNQKSAPVAAARIVTETKNSKITFDSDGEEDSHPPSPKKKNLFMDSDDDDDEDAINALTGDVTFRPEFAGVEGKKLFEMQKRFGGDDRFRLDERFMDEFAADEADTVTHEMGELNESIQAWKVVDADTLAVQQEEQKAEQIRALEVLQDLFPDMKIDKAKWNMDKQPDQKQLGWLASMRRYDPRDANSKSMEQAPPTASERNKALKAAGFEEEDEEDIARKKWVDAPLPETSEERYFTATSDLSTMFSRVRANSEDGEEMEAALDGVVSKPVESSSSGFSFAAMFEQPAEKEIQDWTPGGAGGSDDEHAGRAWHFTDAFHDKDEENVSTDGEIEDDEDTKGSATPAVMKRPIKEVLSFGATFHKPTTWTPKHDEQWVSMRKIYTIDFRRKHKQALKNKKQAKKHHQKK